jgi:nucleotide-binding universal stress UspA family protein
MKKKIEHILVGSDGSAHGNSAVEFAGILANATGAKVSVVYVREPFFAVSAADIGLIPLAEVAQVSQQELEQALEDKIIKPTFENAAKILEPYVTQLKTKVLEGQPAKAICDYARDNDVDLVVIGSRGHSAFTELVLGSVSSQVVHHAPCAVTVIR